MLSSTPQDDLEITFQVEDASASGEGLRLVTKQLAMELADRMSVQTSAAVEDPQHAGSSLQATGPDTGGGAVAVLDAVTGISAEASVHAEFSEELSEELLRTSLPSSLPETPLYRMYRLALIQKDATARFMSLYMILLHLFEDDQALVDKFIRKWRPEVEESSRPDRDGVTETIFSRLRNEFAHRRPDASLEQTLAEMKQMVGHLEELTRKAILRDAETHSIFRAP